ncbi:MAG TPA: four helix bundle protein [Opitutaceae bacterium]|nr:four helix bundle protein [Opitutaceae bacterium]
MKFIPQDDDSFEKLVVWQRSQALAVRIYRSLGDCRDFGFRNRMTDAANSISNNIAEGAERLSRAEFKQFLGYAKGSAGETRSQTYTAADLSYLSPEEALAVRRELKEISRMINGLIRSLDRGEDSSST